MNKMPQKQKTRKKQDLRNENISNVIAHIAII